MGIDNIVSIKPNGDSHSTLEEHHVVMAYASGDHKNVGLYLIGPETKEEARQKAQAEFVADNNIEGRIVIITNFLYSGGSMRALQVYERLSKKYEEKKKEADERKTDS